MGCEEDDLKTLDDLIKRAIASQKSDLLDASNIESRGTDNIDDILDTIESCPVPISPIFTKKQLDDISCIIDSSTELPSQPDLLDLKTESINDLSPEECEKKASSLNEELKIELKEYTDLNILLEKLIEYKDNYKVFTKYFSERAAEMARLMNKFQPVLEDIRRLETEKVELNLELVKVQSALDELYSIVASGQIIYSAWWNDNFDVVADVQTEIQTFIARKKEIVSNIETVENNITKKENLRDTYTSEEDIINDNDITNILDGSTINTVGLIAGTNFITQVTLALTSAGFSSIKNSIKDYSSVIKTDSASIAGIKTLVKTPIISFNLDFIGINSIPIEEDVYNKETGDRSTITINFPIKNNKYLHNNSFFNSVSGVNIKDASINTNLTGDLYEKYYNKLEDPLNLMFSTQDKGLTSSATLVDPKLKGTDFQVKRENSTDYYIRDIGKMQRFYEDFENIFNKRKLEIRKTDVEPLFNGVALNLKKLAVLDVKLFLALGRINLDIIDESQDLKLIIKNIERSQEDFLKNATSLNEEIIRIKARIKELKPTPEKIKKRLAALDMKCFEDKEPIENESELKRKVDDLEGNDPYGVETLKGVDPTLPSANDMKYWLQFSKILNMVNILPLPKDPTSLRYWPIGLVIPTPVKLVKIPLPIVWIPITTLSSPAGQTVIFITINGLFISPVIFNSSSSGLKQHKITIRGATNDFGYNVNKAVKKTISFPLSIAAAKDRAITSQKNPSDELSKIDRDKYELEMNLMKEKIKNAGPSQKKKLNKQINDLRDSISLESGSEILQKNLDRKESPQDAIDDAIKSIFSRLDDLNEPEFNGCRDIQNKITKRKNDIRKNINKTYESKMSIKEKRKKIKEYNKELKKDGISMDSKKKAIKEDISKFFNKVKLPTLSLPKDKTKINPSLTPAESMKEVSDQALTNYEYNLTSKNNKNVRKILLTNITKVTNNIDLTNLSINKNGKLKISESSTEIKNTLLDINEKLFNKVKGKPDPNLNEGELTNKKKVLEKEIQKEINIKKKRLLKKDLKKTDASLSDISDTKDIQESNSIDSDKLSKLSKFKVNFNPFKSLTDMLPVSVDLISLPTAASLPFDSAKIIIDSYIKNLSSESLVSMLGGVNEISPNTIKDSYFNIISANVPKDLNIPDDLNLQTMSSSFSGMFNSLSGKKEEIDILKPFTLSKSIPLNLNILIKPMLDIIVGNMDEVVECLPIDVENDFNSLNPVDLKVNIKNTVLDKIENLSSVLSPVYSVLSLLKSTNGITLNPSDKLSFLSLPFGGIILAKFISEATLKMSTSKSFNTPTFDLKATEKASALIESTINPIMSVPMSYIIPATAAMVQQQSSLRLLHPILNADDIPPWERLSAKNFLFILFLDEFITSAADKIGFYRRFI